jgi:hypothetical protein
MVLEMIRFVTPGKMETIFTGLRGLVLMEDELERNMLDTRFVSDIEWCKTKLALELRVPNFLWSTRNSLTLLSL